MIIAVCDPKGIAIEAIKTILYHDKGLSDRISRIYEFWNMEQLLDASRDSYTCRFSQRATLPSCYLAKRNTTSYTL